MLRQELIPTLQQFAGTVEQPVKLDIGSLDKDIQELIYEGYLIISKSTGETWITQLGLDALGIPSSANDATRRLEEFVDSLWGGFVPSLEDYEEVKRERSEHMAKRLEEIKKRHEEERVKAAEREAKRVKERKERKAVLREERRKEIHEQVKHLDVTPQVLQRLIPGDYTSSEEPLFPFQGVDGFCYSLMPAKEFYNDLLNYIEDRQEEYFGLYDDSGRDERLMMLRTPEEIFSDPDALELIAMNCFFVSDFGGIAYKDDDYVVLRSTI